MARDTTLYLRPPKPAKPRKAVPKTAWQELSGFLFKYRVQLFPFLFALILLTLAVIVGPVRYRGVPVGTGGTTLALLALSWYLYQDRWYLPSFVPWFRLEVPRDHWYAAACAGTCAVWLLGADWGGTKPGPRAIGTLLLGTALCAAPWWHHRRIRGSIPVRFHDLKPAERKAHLEQARSLITNWTAFASAGQIQGFKIRGITYNPWSVAVSVKLRPGKTVSQFTTNRLEVLESAFCQYGGEIMSGTARVERVKRSAIMATLRFMTHDPHAEPISPPEGTGSSIDDIVTGLFETGEKIVFKLVNTVVGGTTGAGKSTLISVVIRALARIPTVAIVGIDLKPGAPELGKWEPVMHALAKTPEEAHDLLNKLQAGFEHRGQVMSANRWRKWRVTRSEPFIVLIVDETQEARQARLMKKLESIAGMIRAYGGCTIMATQYPIGPNVSGTIKANSPQRIGFHVEDDVADRVIFGSRATKQGWRSSVLCPADREGSMLIRSPLYKNPLLGRGFWLEDDEIDEYAAQWAAVRTPIDADTWGALEAGKPAVADSAVSVAVLDGQPVNPGEIVDAVIVDDDPLERVLAALERGRTKVTDVMADTGYSSAAVYRYLRALRDDHDLVRSPRRGVWESTRKIESVRADETLISQ